MSRVVYTVPWYLWPFAAMIYLVVLSIVVPFVLLIWAAKASVYLIAWLIGYRRRNADRYVC